MLRILFKSSVRTLWNNRLYSFIHILGLTLGVCSCLVIWVIVDFEFSFDNFHPDKNRIYRIATNISLTKNEPLVTEPAVIPPVANTVQREIPGIDVVAAYHILSDVYVRKIQSTVGASIISANPIVAGPEYFRIMKYIWLAGNEQTSLVEPHQVVLCANRARTYFGAIPWSEMIGKELIYNDSIYTIVTGIIQDWKGNSEFPFKEFISLSTANSGYLQRALLLDQTQWKGVPYSSRAIVKLEKNASPKVVAQALADLFNRKWHYGAMTGLLLQSLNNIHFSRSYSDGQLQTTHLSTLYALTSIALFILVLAVINYVNLATAQSLTREKEIGIRKVLGSNRTNVMLQFLCETLLLIVVSICLASLLAVPVIHLFRRFIPSNAVFHPFEPKTILFLIATALVTTFLAGLYPAKQLSGFSTAYALNAVSSVRGSEKWLLRKSLIVFQFAISLVFIIGTLVISRQIVFMQTKDLGFKADAIISFETNESRDSLNRVKYFAEKIRQLRGVAAVAIENMPPMGVDRGIFGIQYKSLGNERLAVAAIKADEHYLPLYGIRLLAGRNLLASDTLKEVLINQSLATILGFKHPQEAIGKSIYTWNKFCPIVGVVADFHQASFHESVKPLLIAGMTSTDIAVKLAVKGANSTMVKKIIGSIEEQWKSVYPETVFQYTFLDESLAHLYQKEQTAAMMMKIATGMTIFISCIGLFGLTLFSTARRSKEISIRKVLGAGVSDIAILINKDFIKLIILALVIASPIAWTLMHQWLNDFAYRISFTIDIYIIAGIFILLVAIITTSSLALRAALINPIKNLRTQ